MRTSHGCEPVTVPRIWPSFATSHSTWCAKLVTNDLLKDDANAPLGTRNTCSRSCSRSVVNLDSVPCPTQRPIVRKLDVSRETMMHLVGMGLGTRLTSEATVSLRFPGVVF